MIAYKQLDLVDGTISQSIQIIELKFTSNKSERNIENQVKIIYLKPNTRDCMLFNEWILFHFRNDMFNETIYSSVKKNGNEEYFLEEIFKCKNLEPVRRRCPGWRRVGRRPKRGPRVAGPIGTQHQNWLVPADASDRAPDQSGQQGTAPDRRSGTKFKKNGINSTIGNTIVKTIVSSTTPNQWNKIQCSKS